MVCWSGALADEVRVVREGEARETARDHDVQAGVGSGRCGLCC